ncbi:hypothetical protein THARTR1_05516 [Trichoderma harzianum]|uniref:Uncharacterized protein n=1 Tax=Trichoderma harzianum TaxID=5544 RepID=A0A2K0U952_TRIHA|nr:hypothetical protein THARTR1_05516 [Trichoderma harzianum]
MAYPEFSDPATLLRDAISFDGVPDDLVPSGFVESRIRQLNTISSNDNSYGPNSPYTANTRDGADICSPACQRTRVEVSASPPVGHSYPGLRINDNHNDDNGVAWEVASTSAHKFNVRPSLRASRSINSLRLQSPTRDPSRYRSLYRSNQTANEVNDTKSRFKLSRRSHPNLQASSSSIRTRQQAPEGSRMEQQDVLEMFDMYGVSRPEGWLSDERDRQQASGMNTVQVTGYLILRAVTLSRDTPEKVGWDMLRWKDKHANNFDMNADIAWRSPIAKWPSLSSALIGADEWESTGGKAGASSQESRTQYVWPDNDNQTSPQRRVDGLGNKTATQTLKGLLSLHTLDQDTFWTCSEDPATSQSATLPHTLHGNRDTPTSILEGAPHTNIESVDLERYQASPPDKAIWKTPTIRISPSGENNDVPELQQDVRYDDQMGNTGEQQRQGLSHGGVGSPVRKVNDWTPKTSEKGLGSQDSLRKATSPSKSPQRNIESSDPSTWKQQLRKINDTPTSMRNSPSKSYTLLASNSQRDLYQSATAVDPDEEALPSSSIPHKSNDKDATPTGYKGLEFTSRASKRNQAGDVMKEPTIPSVTPNSNSEISLSRHVCEWRSRYLGLSDSFDKLKSELDIALEQQASQGIAGGELGGASHQHQYDDYGIEGLTIIVHRRSKEDLVLNTDLREEEAAHVEEE